jgi:hypothetical protein
MSCLDLDTIFSWYLIMYMQIFQNLKHFLVSSILDMKYSTCISRIQECWVSGIRQIISIDIKATFSFLKPITQL